MLKYLHYFFLLVNKKYTIGSRPKSGRNFSGLFVSIINQEKIKINIILLIFIEELMI